jgi:hypothetical protein
MMGDSIRITDDCAASPEQWKRIAASCDYATFFHTPQWADIFYRYTAKRLRPVPRKITFIDNTCAVIPLCRKEYFLDDFHLYESSPAGTFGGWISSGGLEMPHTRALVDYMLNLKNVAWRENPYDPFLKGVALPESIEEFTQTIDLTQSSDALRAFTSRAHAKALRKAQREGVTIQEAQSLSDWKEHFKAYESSLIRWKKAGTAKKHSSPYTWDLFKIIFDINPSCRKLWCARYKGALAASVLCFYWNKHAVSWHGAALEEFFGVRPNNLLYQHMIDHARENGFRWFDCNTPGGLKGVIEFKDNLGTQRKMSRFINKASKRRKLVQMIRRLF